MRLGGLLLLGEVSDGVLVVWRDAAGHSFAPLAAGHVRDTSTTRPRHVPHRRGHARLQRHGVRGLAPLPRLEAAALRGLRAAWRAPNGALLLVGQQLLLLHASGATSPALRLPRHTRSIDAAWRASRGSPRRRRSCGGASRHTAEVRE